MAHKDIEERRKYQREYHKKWRLENPKRIKEINKKSESREERIEYKKKWVKDNPDKIEETKNKFKENNQDKIKEYNNKYNKTENGKNRCKKYYSTPKGIANILKKKDKIRFGEHDESITEELVKEVISRDKVCCYCNKKIRRGEYDHINAFKLISKNNIARICSKCNQSKNNADLLQWMKWKKYKITQKILDLYNLAYY